MASHAERFPVALISEQPLIAPARDNVVDHCCGHYLALHLTEGAQRMLLQEKGAGLASTGIVQQWAQGQM